MLLLLVLKLLLTVKLLPVPLMLLIRLQLQLLDAERSEMLSVVAASCAATERLSHCTMCVGEGASKKYKSQVSIF